MTDQTKNPRTPPTTDPKITTMKFRGTKEQCIKFALAMGCKPEDLPADWKS